MVIMEKRSVNDGEVLNTVVVKYDELSHDVLASITASVSANICNRKTYKGKTIPVY